MNLLAIDTSTSAAILAVTRRDGRRFGVRSDPAARHGRSLIPDIRALLADAGLSLADLDGIAVGLGPGSFTGLRIGVTAAKVLAFAAKRPLYSLDSLELRARRAPDDARRIAVLTDAQRGEVLVAYFTREAVGARPVPSGVPALVNRTAWSEARESDLFVLDAIPGGVPPDGTPWPEPADLADLAVDAARMGRVADPFGVEPNYLRRSAAEEKADAAGPSPSTTPHP